MSFRRPIYICVYLKSIYSTCNINTLTNGPIKSSRGNIPINVIFPINERWIFTYV